MNISIYTISCPVSGLVKYVGKTKNAVERFRKHISEKNKTKKCRWIIGLKNKGLLPVFDIIDTVHESVWQDAERGYIRLYKSIGADLLNEMPGGEGGATMLGKKLTKEQALKISLSKIGKPNPAASASNKTNKGFCVAKYDLNWNYLDTYQSINDAAKSVGRSSRRIQKMIAGGNVNHVGGFKFKKV